MIAQLKGVVIELERRAVVLDVAGVGYRVMVGVGLLEKISVGQELTLKIYHHITDSDQLLFGFEAARDLEYFELLLTVPSVGPKTAMGILDAAPPAVLTQAVFQKDMIVLTGISGVGRRTAERILVELSGKLAQLPIENGGKAASSIQQEAMEALVAIGFKPAQAKAAVQKLPADVATVEQAVKAALKQ